MAMEFSEETCRYYLAEWPEEGEVVVARVISVGVSASYVLLHEYGDREAMLPHSELSNRRLRSVHKHVRPAQLLCVRVTGVDPDKGYIDVSKRQVEEQDEIQVCEQRYARGKLVQGVVRRLGELLGLTSVQQLEDLNRRTAWRLDTQHDRQTAACDVFKQAYSNPDVLRDLDLDSQTLTILLEIINHRFCPGNVKIRADVAVMCWSSEGVDAIKASLKAGQNLASAELPLQVAVVAPPVYAITCTTQTSQQTAALAVVKDAVTAIKNTICQFKGGKFQIRDEPAVVGETYSLDQSMAD